jgi:hypothetical protein
MSWFLKNYICGWATLGADRGKTFYITEAQARAAMLPGGRLFKARRHRFQIAGYGWAWALRQAHNIGRVCSHSRVFS